MSPESYSQIHKLGPESARMGKCYKAGKKLV